MSDPSDLSDLSDLSDSSDSSDLSAVLPCPYPGHIAPKIPAVTSA